ncbi:MAG TPA: methyltransferase domain-containing protein [Ktedonobacterales bacterium]|nr:methyltransferase domain-containing protein [Ktedonobacterales bacterium]
MSKRDDAARERMDAPDADVAALRRSLADIRRLNAMLGWTTFTTRAVAGYVRSRGLRDVRLLDVACGSADIPRAIARWATRAGVRADILATDANPTMLAVAREVCAGIDTIHFEARDALALPYEQSSFDIALCTLALHHFTPDDAIRLLRELARVGRQVFVFDLVRSRPAYVGALALTRLARMDPMTRYDGPLSVRRAYTAPELRDMAVRAGLSEPRVRVAIPFRLSLSAQGATEPQHRGEAAS